LNGLMTAVISFIHLSPHTTVNRATPSRVPRTIALKVMQLPCQAQDVGTSRSCGPLAFRDASLWRVCAPLVRYRGAAEDWEV
jgi:hypothetical protein